MKFTNIPDSLKYPPRYRAKLSSLHSDVIDYAMNHYDGTNEFTRKSVNLINCITYAILHNEYMDLDFSKSIDDLMDMFPDYDIDFLIDKLGAIFVDRKSVEWDIEIPSEPDIVNAQPVSSVTNAPDISKTKSEEPTPKEDLFLRGPTIPRFDPDKIWLQFYSPEDRRTFHIYEALPTIPTKQRDICITTDVNRMSDKEIMALYPNRFIRTRAEVMYTPVPGMDFDEQLGILFPVDGFTSEQLRDNIIKYPHIYKWDRLVGKEGINFYDYIELDVELHGTLDVWDNLPESKIIPKKSEFIKEYVARRYLLERDYHTVEHKHPLRGDFRPFITLFTTPEDYKKFGYNDPVALGREAVQARVIWWRSRNPIIAKYKAVYGGDLW